MMQQAGTVALRRGMTRDEVRIIIHTSLAHAISHTLELTYAAVLVAIQVHFGVGLFILGLIANLGALGYGVAALPSGFLADRIGSRRVVAASLGGAGVMGLLVAFSPSISVLAVALMAMGLAAGLYHPAGVSFIARGVRERTLGLGYHGMAGNLGVALAPAIAGGLAGLVNWRLSFVVFSILALGVALLVATSSVGERSAGSPVPASPRSPLRWREGLRQVRPVLGPLLAIFAMNISAGFIYRGALTFLPLHVKEQVHLGILGMDPVALAGSLTTVALLFGVLGQYAGGLLGERVRRELLIVPLMVVMMPALLLLGGATGALVVVAASLFAFFYFMAQPSVNALIADYAPRSFQGSVYGIGFFATFGLGSFSGTFAGYIAQRMGTPWVFFSLGAFAAVSFLLALYLFLGSGKNPRPANQ